MSYSIDSFFSIGSTHNVCQDYAIHGKTESIHYGIVSDGCSSAKDSDIGSRILCKIAEEFLISKYDYSLDIENNYDLIESFILKKISKLNLKLPSETYYSTLIIFVANKDFIDVFIFGDGCIKVVKKDSEIIKLFKYSKNAPYYLAYKLNSEHKKTYFETFKQVLEIKNKEMKDNQINSELIAKEVDEKIFYRFENKDLISISIMSDGVESFQNEIKKDIEEIEIVQNITNYKNINGTFVDRRLKAFFRDCNKNKIQNKDDLSIVSLIKNV